MRYSKSMIEAVKQVGLYEALDYAIIDGDNKIIGLYKGNMAKKQAQLNMKGAERQVGVKKPLKIMPVSKKKVGDTVIGIGELTDKERGEIEEDRKNALAGFDNRIRDAASMDRKDFIKAKELYKRKDVKGLRKHIYSLDTSPLEVVMNLISIQDRPFFDKMYPNTRGGEFLARIAYQHRHLDENLDENKDDEKKRMKGAKLRLKMGDETIKEQKMPSHAELVKGKYADAHSGLQHFSRIDGKEYDWNYLDRKGGKYVVTSKKTGEIGLSRAGSKKFKTAKVIKEDGHTDVSSAVRQCKTITEDAMQIMGKLQSMSGEDSLPTWWTNKLAVASNSMNKIRDYLLVPSMQESVDEGKMSQIATSIDDIANAMKRNRNMKPFIDKFKEEKNGAQHFSKIEEDNYVWNFVYDDFGRTKLTTEPDKATHLVYTMEGKDNPQLLKISEKEILDYKKGETNEVSKK